MKNTAREYFIDRALAQQSSAADAYWFMQEHMERGNLDNARLWQEEARHRAAWAHDDLIRLQVMDNFNSGE
jgi:hypothetical protein